jgi:hypothetical protein
MRQLVVFVGFLVIMSGLGGCQNANSGIEVIIEGGGEFPESLAGVWRADKNGWEFVFEPDGKISSAVITLGRVRMKPGEVTTVPMKMGGKGIYEPGEWMLYYIPVDRELMVKISLKNFHVELGKDSLEGKSTDIFNGPVSKDGKLWQVNWTSYFDYVAHTSQHPDFIITEDPNRGISQTLIFQKVTEE